MTLSAASIAVCLTFVLCMAPGCENQHRKKEYDLILRGGMLLDGTGKSGSIGDLAIRGDRIAAIGGKVEGYAPITIDATGLMVAPGFIDMHTHSDEFRLQEPHGPSFSLQGVTTEVWGEAFSMGPLGGKREDLKLWGNLKPTWKTLGEFLDVVEKRGSAANFCSYIGSGAVRAYIVGYEDRPATAREIEEEKRIVREAMADGAMGVASGLSYVPNIYMSTGELTALAKEAAAAGGIYATHARTVNGQDPAAIQEAISIGEKAGLPVHFFHLNSIASWSAGTFLPIIRDARKRGLRVTADAYPYNWGITRLPDYLPSWALAGGRNAMLARLQDPKQRKRIRKTFRSDPPYYARIGWKNVRLGVADSEINGKLVSEVAALRHQNEDDVYMDVVLKQKGQGILIDLNNGEDTLRQVMQEPFVAVGSDGRAVNLDTKPPAMPLFHPRNLATYPRWLGRYVREEHLMTWEEAVRRMTSLPASILGLRDRGVLELGKMADVVVFDPKTIVDRATFEDPNHYSEGVRYVFVNGQAVVRDGKPTDALPGRAIRGPGYKKRSGA
jgi:N-acyl-D-amino-acid deacylase